MNKVELLLPAGDFESIISAVQNGADAVYFGANKFNSRINSTNFKDEELSKAITYAKLRNVKTYLTLNTLIKNNEFEEAIKTLEIGYKAGIDGVIIQDLGLAKKVMEIFPDLEVHGSTQMTIHNLNGVRKLEKLGFKRVVLARELNINEIEEICENAKLDIEIFIHGALCISYSGQCLMSSIIGGRSGNRGKCAGTCRLPYELINKENSKVLDKGYLLSSKDVTTLEILPELIKAGVKSFKIEGRMKSPEYVGIVTRIYRKYIDLAYSDEEYIVDNEDKEELLQIFNRGGSSTGYLKSKLGKEMMCTKKPNHMGVLIGEVHSYNPNKGYVKFKPIKEIELGDSISINNESCKISELMEGNNNIKTANIGQAATIGRIKGNIKQGDKIYRTVSINLNKDIEYINSKENIRRKVKCKLELRANELIKIELEDTGANVNIEYVGTTYDCPQKAEKTGTAKDRIVEQISKTGDTIFDITDIEIDMEDGIFVPISSINKIRREGLEKLEQEIIETFRREYVGITVSSYPGIGRKMPLQPQKISILLNTINANTDYAKIKEVDNIYIPISEVIDCRGEQCSHDFKKMLKNICNTFNTYIYLPIVAKSNYEKLIHKKLNDILDNEKIKGIVVSNISQLELLKEINRKDLKIIANYTMNIFNNNSVKELEGLGFNKVILSPELDKNNINSIAGNIQKEVIVYGRTLLMTSEYCPIGRAKDCDRPCKKGKYVLKDRLGFEFPVYTNDINCNTFIYNSKITSIDYSNLDIDSIRIDILDESIDEINNIIQKCKRHERIEGQNYTNGNINKDI